MCVPRIGLSDWVCGLCVCVCMCLPCKCFSFPRHPPSSVDGARSSIFKRGENYWLGLLWQEAAILATCLRRGWQGSGTAPTLSSVQLCAENTLMGQNCLVEINASFPSAANKACIPAPPQLHSLVPMKVLRAGGTKAIHSPASCR